MVPCALVPETTGVTVAMIVTGWPTVAGDIGSADNITVLLCLLTTTRTEELVSEPL
jgi:hypothetical protein